MTIFRVGGLYRIKQLNYINIFNENREWVLMKENDLILYLYPTIMAYSILHTFLFGEETVHWHTGVGMENPAWFEKVKPSE